MYKSEHYQKVEKLIEMRTQLRRLIGTVEAIEANIALWRDGDKLDEYWDTVWQCELAENGLGTAVAALKADLEFLQMIFLEFRRNIYILDGRLVRRANLKRELLRRSMNSGWPVKQKIVRLQAVARKCRLKLNETLKYRWKVWKRRHSGISLSYVEEVAREVVLLEAEIESCWSRIWRGPVLACADSLPDRTSEERNDA